MITFYKSFVGLIYDQLNNEHFYNMTERVKYNVALAITGAVEGTSQQKA